MEEKDGFSVITIKDGLSYLLVPEGSEAPAWADGQDYTVIRQPVKRVYLAASSAMDLVDALGLLSVVKYTSTDADDWSLPDVQAALDGGEMAYVGKYSAPDYERVYADGCDLAIESTMIYHTPKVKEEWERLGIPVLVERSSYENDPLGRLEWIRLYGLLLGREDEADAYFKTKVGELRDELAGDSEAETDRPTVAFFSINSHGDVTIRKPGDYVTNMIEMAGGEYVPADEKPEEENALSTMTIPMEKFYNDAADADILIYNSTIQKDVESIDELTEKSPLLSDFKAVKSGKVWCTNKNVFQQTTAVCDMIREMHGIFRGDDGELGFFHRVE